MGNQRDAGRQRHGAKADRVDIVEVGALEFDAGRGEAKRLVDEEIGGDRAKPCHGDNRKDAQGLLEQPVDAKLHQEQRNRHVEDEPDDAARMAVRKA